MSVRASLPLPPSRTHSRTHSVCVLDVAPVCTRAFSLSLSLSLSLSFSIISVLYLYLRACLISPVAHEDKLTVKQGLQTNATGDRANTHKHTHTHANICTHKHTHIYATGGRPSATRADRSANRYKIVPLHPCQAPASSRKLARSSNGNVLLVRRTCANWRPRRHKKNTNVGVLMYCLD